MEWSGRPARFARYTSRTLYPGVRDERKDKDRLLPIGKYYVRNLERMLALLDAAGVERSRVSVFASDGAAPAPDQAILDDQESEDFWLLPRQGCPFERVRLRVMSCSRSWLVGLEAPPRTAQSSAVPEPLGSSAASE